MEYFPCRWVIPNKPGQGGYFVIVYVGFFVSPLLVFPDFRPIPDLYADFPAFYAEFSHY